VIADNVGDNVGDVAGMGADLFESYVGAIISTMAARLAARLADQGPSARERLLIYFRSCCRAIGIVARCFGGTFVKATTRASCRSALFGGLIAASAPRRLRRRDLTPVIMQPTPDRSFAGTRVRHWGVYPRCDRPRGRRRRSARSPSTTPRRRWPGAEIAQQSQTGAATNIIHGLATGMASTWIPTILLALAIYLCNDLAGMYGICVAAVGMLSTLGISLGVDAYGPVADNAGGIAEMSAPAAGSPQAHRLARRGRQHHGGDRQGLRDRLGGADRARAVLGLQGRGRQGHRTSASTTPTSSWASDRRHAAVPVQLDGDEGRRQGRQRDGRRSPPPVPRDPRA
jgi:hypothetical protein